MDKFIIKLTQPDNSDAKRLQDELSDILYARFESDGRYSFQDWIENDNQYIFVVIYKKEEPVGCGAIRPLSNEIAELKRMFTKYNRQGIGQKILSALESEAKKNGYERIWLETRVTNNEACSFYHKNDYYKIDNYGIYEGRDNAICFEKILV